MQESNSPLQATEIGTAHRCPEGLKFIQNSYLAFIVFVTLAFVAKISLKFGDEINVPEFLLLPRVKKNPTSNGEKLPHLQRS